MRVRVLFFGMLKDLAGKANEKFDSGGNLTDEAAKQLIRQLLENLVAWMHRLARKLPEQKAA